MSPQSIRKTALLVTALVLLANQAFSETRYDRDLVVKDETRAMMVEKVFKELIAAYEDEDPQGFLDRVSDDRFRQDYITFTDALYSDFRNYEIHQVEYWIDRVVSDHIKQFLFVKWEKRYETLESGRQNTLSGYSRFLFDEVNGKYLLIELAGNPLFGGSLQEWREEMPPIAGQVAPITQTVNNSTTKPHPSPSDPVPSDHGTGESGNVESCDNAHLFLCDAGNCASVGGYWYNGSCNSQPGLPDLVITEANLLEATYPSKFRVTIRNNGVAESTGCDIVIEHNSFPGPIATSSAVPPLAPNASVTLDLEGMGIDDTTFKATVDISGIVKESDETNNTFIFSEKPW